MSPFSTSLVRASPSAPAATAAAALNRTNVAFPELEDATLERTDTHLQTPFSLLASRARGRSFVLRLQSGVVVP